MCKPLLKLCLLSYLCNNMGMKNKKFLLVITLFCLLTSCNNSNDSTTHPLTPTGPTVEANWSNEALKLMKSYLGEYLPGLPEMNTFRAGQLSGSTKPYFNPYIKDSPDYKDTYKSLLLENGYTFLSQENNDGVDVFYYSKGYINVSYSYYFNEGSNWFDVYAYNDFELNEIPSDYTLKLEPTDFGKSYSDSSFNKNGYSITYKQIINNANSIQFKKESGEIKISGKLINKMIIEFNSYAQYLFVYKEKDIHFNNGGLYDDINSNEITLKNEVISTETSHITTINAIYIY